MSHNHCFYPRDLKLKLSNIWHLPEFQQELKALLDPEFSIITTFLELYLDDSKSENSDL